MQQLPEHAECVFRRGESSLREVRHRGVRLHAATGGLGSDDGRELAERMRLVGRQSRAVAEIGDHAFKRLDLCGELAGRDAITSVFDLQKSVRRAELVYFYPCAPFRAETNQNGKGKYR